jgi:D-3-phosphoglycerate dehydrogenase
LGDIVNFVNAPVMAEERGIRVTEESTMKAEDYASLIAIKASSKEETHSITGTLFGKKEPRLIELDGCPLGGAVLAGHLLLIRNEDRPGVLGKVGTLLGGQDINIASITVGRDRKGGAAVTLLALDASTPETMIGEMSAFPNVLYVRHLELPQTCRMF